MGRQTFSCAFSSILGLPEKLAKYREPPKVRDPLRTVGVSRQDDKDKA